MIALRKFAHTMNIIKFPSFSLIPNKSRITDVDKNKVRNPKRDKIVTSTIEVIFFIYV